MKREHLSRKRKSQNPNLNLMYFIYYYSTMFGEKGNFKNDHFVR